MPKVWIKQVSPAGPSLLVDLEEGEELSGGVGGWQSLDRPHRRAAVYWAGTPVQTYTLPVTIDGMGATQAKDRSVDQQCAQLLAWALPSEKGGETVDPPVLQVTGPVLAKPGQRWVLNDLVWGDFLRGPKGHRIQQTVTLTLLEYRAPSIVTSHAKKAAAKANAKNKAKGKSGVKK